MDPITCQGLLDGGQALWAWTQLHDNLLHWVWMLALLGLLWPGRERSVPTPGGPAGAWVRVALPLAISLALSLAWDGLNLYQLPADLLTLAAPGVDQPVLQSARFHYLWYPLVLGLVAAAAARRRQLTRTAASVAALAALSAVAAVALDGLLLPQRLDRRLTASEHSRFAQWRAAPAPLVQCQDGPLLCHHNGQPVGPAATCPLEHAALPALLPHLQAAPGQVITLRLAIDLAQPAGPWQAPGPLVPGVAPLFLDPRADGLWVALDLQGPIALQHATMVAVRRPLALLQLVLGAAAILVLWRGRDRRPDLNPRATRAS